MSKSPLSHRGTSRLKTPIWSAIVAAVALLLCVGVSALAVVTSRDSQKVRLPPAGQLQADARTLVAAFTFLFDDPLSSSPEMPSDTAVLCASNVKLQPSPSAALCCLSNQSELFSELITNVPARS